MNATNFPSQKIYKKINAELKKYRNELRRNEYFITVLLGTNLYTRLIIDAGLKFKYFGESVGTPIYGCYFLAQRDGGEIFRSKPLNFSPKND